jgi:uncharacterized protein Veg
VKAYLDNNVVISIEENVSSIEQLQKKIDSSITMFPYSSAHLQEALELKHNSTEEREKFLLKRCGMLDEISACNYLVENLQDRKVYFFKTKAIEMCQQIDNDFATNAIKGFINLTLNSVKQEIRKYLNIDSSRLNNYKPSEIIEHLNTKLPALGENLSFIELIEGSSKYNISGKEFDMRHYIGGIFEFLDMLGYWKDKYTEKSNFARLMDARHTFFATFCDYFVSNDKRTRFKARVVYDYYNIGTKVVDSEGNE